MSKRSKFVDGSATPASLVSLSEDTATVVAAWLSPRDLRHVVFASKSLLDSALYQVYCRLYLRLRIPVDPQDCADAMVAYQRVRDAKRTLPTRVALGLPSQLASLLTVPGVQDEIEHIEITPRRACIQYPQSYDEDDLDVAVIAEAAPSLEILSASRFFLQQENAFASLQRLRRLELHDVKVTSWRFGEALTRLEQFTCRLCYAATSDLDLSQWRPLKVLELDYRAPLPYEQRIFRAIEQVHLPAGEKLRVLGPKHPAVFHTVSLAAQPSPRLVDLAITPNFIDGGIQALSALSSMRQLTSLCLWWDGAHLETDVQKQSIDDASPLACLVNLETLKLRMSRQATTCRPLRALTRLRELYLGEGWLLDFVESLSHLEKLSVRDIYGWRTFYERDAGRNDRVEDRTFLPHLREVLVGKEVDVNDYAMHLIQRTQSLQLHMLLFEWKTLFQVNKLEYLTSFEFDAYSSGLFDATHWTGEQQVLSCIQTLESLRLRFCDSPLEDFPWSLAGATRLRFISLSKVSQGVLETLAKWSSTLVQLEEIYLDRYEGKSLAPLLELHTLRIVGIHYTVDCRRLRGAQGVGGALPHLRTILHDGFDCLWRATCPILAHWGSTIELLGVH